MKKFFKYLDKILGITILVCAVGFCAYVGFVNPDLLKPTYSVTLEATGITLDVTEYSVKSGHTLSLPTPEKEGYTFDGWFNGDTLWTAESKVSADTKLVAKWTPKNYAITFVVNGIEHIKQFPYGSLPYFDGDLSRTPTKTISYTFSGWQPALTTVSGNATYTATFYESTRLYSVTASSSFNNAGTITGAGEFEYGQSSTISITPNPGYNFLGWFKNGELISTLTSFNVDNISSDTHLEARFSLIKYPITYFDYFGTLANPSFFTVEDKFIDLVPQHLNGYTFLGWYTESGGNGTKIDRIDCSSLTALELYAHYSLDTYSISYDLSDGSVAGTNPNSYTVLDSNITLINPTKENHIFVGWSGTGISGTTNEVVIYSGSFGNRHYTAIFEPLYVTVSFVADGINLSANQATINRGQSITPPLINATSYGMSGYSCIGWYTDHQLTSPYDFSSVVTEDLTLYGSWEYLLESGFMKYITKFTNATTTKTLTITSEDELIKWIEYVSFYSIPQSENIKITFSGISVSFASKDELFLYMNSIQAQSTFPNENTISYNYNPSTFTPTSIFSVDRDQVASASLTYNPERIDTLSQETNALLKTSSGRGAEFDSFNINKVQDSITVSTSNQLVYALSSGLKPLPVQNSSAELVLEKAKAVLNKIISPEMTETDKTRAIYDWLINSVTYDHLSANTAESNNEWPWQNYDAWYAEGVFNNGLAVCDGYSKAFIILAKLENIPAIRVTGNGHAWNRVYLSGEWYGIDATHGDLGFNSSEVNSYTNFLFTDAYKSSLGYETSDYSTAKATIEFDYYDYETCGDYDLLINSSAEFDAIMEVVKTATKTTTYFTLEIKIDKTFASSLSGSISALISRAKTLHGITFYEPIERKTDTTGTVYLLLFE